MTTLNNRTLTIVLVALVGVYLGARFIRVPQREGALVIPLGGIDTAFVTEIKLYPHAEDHGEVVFTRAGRGWQVAHGGLTAEADTTAIERLLVSFLKLEGNRVVTEQAEKWDDYNVGDTSGTHILVIGDNGASLGEWWVGEAPSQNGMYGSAQSYVRVAGNDKVYVVDDDRYLQYDKRFDDWRNKALLRVDRHRISGVTASGAETWSLMRDSTTWLLAGTEADSTAAERYIGRLASVDVEGFADGFSPGDAADASLAIHGAEGDLALIQAWQTSDSTWTLLSSQRPEVYMEMSNEKWNDIMPTVSVLKGD